LYENKEFNNEPTSPFVRKFWLTSSPQFPMYSLANNIPNHFVYTVLLHVTELVIIVKRFKFQPLLSFNSLISNFSLNNSLYLLKSYGLHNHSFSFKFSVSILKPKFSCNLSHPLNTFSHNADGTEALL
jgi:hypothetical protein